MRAAVIGLGPTFIDRQITNPSMGRAAGGASSSSSAAAITTAAGLGVTTAAALWVASRWLSYRRNIQKVGGCPSPCLCVDLSVCGR